MTDPAFRPVRVDADCGLRRVRSAQRSLILASAAWVCLAASVAAQGRPTPAAVPAPPSPSVVTPQPSPSQGYTTSYQQETAREYLQRRAQAKVEARQARLEAMRWLGYSPLRPTVTSTPFSSYTPSWGSYSVGHYWSYPYWHYPVHYAP